MNDWRVLLESLKEGDMVKRIPRRKDQSLRDFGVWVEAIIKGKVRIERLVKKSERPCSARLKRDGTVAVARPFGLIWEWVEEYLAPF